MVRVAGMEEHVRVRQDAADRGADANNPKVSVSSLRSNFNKKAGGGDYSSEVLTKCDISNIDFSPFQTLTTIATTSSASTHPAGLHQTSLFSSH